MSKFMAWQKKFGMLYQKFHIRNEGEFMQFLNKGSDRFIVRIYSSATHLLDVESVRAKERELYEEDIKSIIERHPTCVKIAALLGPMESQTELIICTKK